MSPISSSRFIAESYWIIRVPQYAIAVVTTKDQRFALMLKQLERQVSDFVIPVYGLDTQRRVFGIGSGVLIRWHSGEYVLVTAGHVLDWHEAVPLFTWGGTAGFIPLGDRSAVTTMPAGCMRDADKKDLAVLLLNRATVLSIKRTDARFGREDLFWRTGEMPDGFYSFMGSPNEVNEVVAEPDAKGRLIRTKPRHFVSFRVRPAPVTAYRRANCSPRDHFVGVFDHRQLYADDQRSSAPHPRGSSGGGVFFWGAPMMCTTGDHIRG
jgi:hypothetical protein